MLHGLFYGVLETFFLNYFQYFFFLSLAFFVYLSRRFFKQLAQTFWKHKFFFLFIFLLSALISLNLFPAHSLVYYDEQNYLLVAQNIHEMQENGLCSQRFGGECVYSQITPHGDGAGILYSLFYDYESDYLNKKIAFFVFLLYLLNSLLVYNITKRLFQNEMISKTSALLMLFLPMNLVYSTNIMPATVSNTFLLFSFYSLIDYSRQQLGSFDKNNSLAVFFISLSILSFFRIEYSVILFMSMIYFVIALFRKKRTFSFAPKEKLLVVIVLVNLLLAGLHLLLKMKINSDADFGLKHLNGTYIFYFVSDWAFIFLSFAALIYLFLLQEKKDKKKSPEIKWFFLFVFTALISVYSFYNYHYVYRFIIPISSIYVICSSVGLVKLSQRIIKKNNVRKIIILSVLFLICLSFVNYAFVYKRNFLEKSKDPDCFLELIEKNNLERIMGSADLNRVVFNFYSSYLGQIGRLPTYIDDKGDLSRNLLNSGYDVYFISNVFGGIKSTHFTDTDIFMSTELYKEPECDRYKIYMIDLINST